MSRGALVLRHHDQLVAMTTLVVQLGAQEHLPAVLVNVEQVVGVVAEAVQDGAVVAGVDVDGVGDVDGLLQQRVLPHFDPQHGGGGKVGAVVVDVQQREVGLHREW